MSQKFLSDVVLSTLTAGSILKLDSNGKIVEAVDGTDYVSSSATGYFTASSGSGIYYSGDVRIGTYQTTVAPDAKLHIFDYQTTEPKLLIEDGNTGDASMQFKVSTQSYTIGIDNSNSDKFVLSAGSELGTGNLLEITSGGLAAFQNSVLVKGTLYVNNQEQIQQGATEKIATFQNLGTERGYFEVTDIGKGYFYADGFKTGATTVGFLKSDGTVDTGSFFSGAYGDLTGTPTLGTMAAANTSDYKTSDEVETYVAGELTYTNISGTPTLGTAAATDSTDYATAAQGALADSALQSLPTHNHDGRYYTKTESDGKYAVSGDNFVPINANDSNYQQSTEGVVLSTNSTYVGLAFPNGGKNFVFEVSIKGDTNANHQGIFWGLDTLASIYGNGESGYKLTHQGEQLLHIRDIATNTNQSTYQAPFTPNDRQWHRYKLIQYFNASEERYVFKVYIDGNKAFDLTQGQFNAPPQQPTYFGFINYTGDVEFSNWNVREITGEEDLLIAMGEGLFQPAGDYLTSLPAHHHDARYYTETEMDTFLSGKLSTSGGTLYKSTNTTGTSGTSFLTLHNYVGSDISQQQSFVDFMFTDGNANFTPQVRIGAQVGRDADANQISKEGAGSFVVYTGNGTDESGGGSLSESFRVSYNGNITAAGSIYSGSNKVATESYVTTALSDYKTSDDTETYVAQELLSYTPTSSFGSNAFTSYTDHTGLYDTVGTGAAEASAVQDNLDSFVSSLGTAAYSATGDFAPAGNYADGTTYQTYGTGNNGWLMPDYNNNTSNFMRMYYDDGSREFRMYSYHGAAGEAKIALYDGGAFNTLSSTNIAQFKTAYGWGNHADEPYATTDYVNTAISNLVDTAPAALNTLNELAAALGDDENFSTTVSNNIGAVDQRVTDLEPLVAANSTDIATNRTEITNLSAAIPTNNNQLTNGAGYLTELPSHNHDGRYYTETEADSRFHRTGTPLVLDARGADIGGSASYVTGGSGDASLEAILNNVVLNLNTSGDEPATIYFKSGVNEPSDFAYISFLPNKAGTSEEAVLQLGVENDGAGSSDYIRLQGRVSTVVDYVSSEATVIQDWVYQGTQKAYIDVSGNLQLDGSITASGYNKTNWDTAYGWGNHASAGYITSADGGNAGTLDGIDSTGFVKQLADTESPDYLTPSSRRVNPNASNPTNAHYAITTFGNGGNVTGQLATHFQTGKLYSRGYNSSWSAWNAYATESYADGAAASVNDRIDTEVFDAIATVDGNIPTNNNQLTNGAGYITAVPSTFDATSIGIGSKVTISESTDRADLLYINSHTSSWGGLQIGNTSNEFIFSLMGNGNAGGIYDDQNGDWIIYWDENAGVQIKHNSSTKLLTVSDGVNITGRLYASSGIQVPYGSGEHRPMVVLSGATNYGLFHTEATNDKFTFDFNGDQKFQFSQDGIFTINGNTITTGKVTNWDTAHGWGNHASAGYALQEELDNLTSTVSTISTDVSNNRTEITALGTAVTGKLDATAKAADSNLLDGINSTSFLRSDVSDIYDGRTLSFGTAGNGTNTSGAFLTIEGNTDSSGEGSGRMFFREHNSTTAAADNYGFSIGYRGGGTTVNSAMGNSWTGLASIGNGEWGMWGHNNDATGALIMHGDRAGTYVDFSGNNIQGINNAYIANAIHHTGDTNTYMQFHANDEWRVVTGGTERLQVKGSDVYVNTDFKVSGSYTEIGNGIGSVSNDGSWNARLNVAGSQHARLDVKSVSDGIITSMFSHTGHGTGKVGTYSNHGLSLMVNGGEKVQINTEGHMLPNTDRTQWLGLETNRWQVVFCEILDSAGQHEKNLQNPEGEKSVGEYETGTVLVWKGGKNLPCTEAADHMRMGIAVKGIDSPLIQGAEPVLVTGSVKEGDYLVTSSKEGHAEAISPEFMRQHGLYDCVLGKALESAEGESHLVKTWINI